MIPESEGIDHQCLSFHKEMIDILAPFAHTDTVIAREIFQHARVAISIVDKKLSV